MTASHTIPLSSLDAVLFDLDGVITDTAAMHARAWKQMFDDFLSSRPGQKPFDIDEDYAIYVDGKPRGDGVISFLQSRGIDLPYGDPGDPAQRQSVCGLGNRKNRIFQQLIETERPAVFPRAVAFVHTLRAARIKTALVTSSRNGRLILTAAGISDIFDLVVDGNDARREQIKGKPAPDIFLYTAGLLNVAPARCAVVEDAISGVAAGRGGGFGYVIGVARQVAADALLAGGADIVVSGLDPLSLLEIHGERLRLQEDAAGDSGAAPQTPRTAVRPWALERIAEICDACPEGEVVVFLDYDGTVSPIVARPEAAEMDEEMRRAIAALARHAIVAVVSGRDLPDVRRRVGLDDLYYAGSHGFDIAGPHNRPIALQIGDDLLPSLDEAERQLQKSLAAVVGAQVERKKFSLAVHYRNVAPSDHNAVKAAVEATMAGLDGLRLTSGKMVYDLQPDVEWHKGRAVRHLLDEILEIDRTRSLVFYIGDDTTDEDAFRELADGGITIVVDETGQRTSAARYHLKDPQEVERFLRRLPAFLEQCSSSRDWHLRYEGFDPDKQGLREALTTVGNGYFCTRGASTMAAADGTHYPGTYLAGGYNRLTTEIRGHLIENEDLVNLPNWLPLTFRIGQGPWIDLQPSALTDYVQVLDLRHGIWQCSFLVRDAQGRTTAVRERRFVHMEHPHLAGLEWTITALDWSGPLEIRSAIDGGVINDGVARYRGLSRRHLRTARSAAVNADTVILQTRTSQSDVHIGVAARTRLFRNAEPIAVARRTLQMADQIGHICPLEITSGQSIRVEKIVALYTSRDAAISDPGIEAADAAARAADFESLRRSHIDCWRHLWRRFRLDLEPVNRDIQHGVNLGLIVHLYIFHLLQTTSINILRLGLDVGVPARGWHGEAYRGHVFWDELFIFPTINLRLPEITRNLLMYRYRRLPAARAAARAEGFAGAMFPWQSGSSGREESQLLHLNPHSGNWLPDHSRLQRHVNIAIAYNLDQYYQVNHDTEFMAFYGAEMMLEIARFLSSLARYNERLGRYEILGVMGPDEYHDAYPDARRPGLDNNAYTNIMTVWVLERACSLLEELPSDVRDQVRDKLSLRDEELSRWQDIGARMRVVFHGDGIISQFEGYDKLLEFDWEGYRREYGDIQRLDRILENEGDTVNRYKASKQADVLMLFYLLSAEELSEIFEKLGYDFAYDTIPKNIDYYLRRTSHGSTLSHVVHAWVLSRSGRVRSWEQFCRALQSDIADIQGGTTAEGIHLAAMAGVVDQLQRGYTGIVSRGDVLWFNPALPSQLKCLHMNLRYRAHALQVTIDHRQFEIEALRTVQPPIRIGFRDAVHELRSGDRLTFKLSQVRDEAKQVLRFQLNEP